VIDRHFYECGEKAYEFLCTKIENILNCDCIMYLVNKCVFFSKLMPQNIGKKLENIFLFRI
jgi:hypothetical protein